MTNIPEDNSMSASKPRPEVGSRIDFRIGPQAFPNLTGFSRSAVALFRLGTYQARLAAALMVVAGCLLYQTGAQTLEQSSREVLYLDAPSVSLQHAEKAGEIARSYTAPDSGVNESVLTWVGEAAPPEDARRALASITGQPERPAGGISYDEAVSAGNTMVAQIGGDSPAGGGSASGELASVDPVRPKLGDGTRAPSSTEQGTVSDQQSAPTDTGGSGGGGSQNPAPSELGLPAPMAEDYAPPEESPTDNPGDEELAAVPGGDHEGATGPISGAYAPDTATTDEKGSDGAEQDETAQAPLDAPTSYESGQSGDSTDNDGVSPIIVPVPDASDEQAEPDKQPEEYAEASQPSPSGSESSNTEPEPPAPSSQPSQSGSRDSGESAGQDERAVAPPAEEPSSYPSEGFSSAPDNTQQAGRPEPNPGQASSDPPGQEEPMVQESGLDTSDGQGVGNGNQPEVLIDTSDTEPGTQHLSVVVHQESDATGDASQQSVDPKETADEQDAPGQSPNTTSGAPGQDQTSKPESAPEAGSGQALTATSEQAPEQTSGRVSESMQQPVPSQRPDQGDGVQPPPSPGQTEGWPETAPGGDTIVGSPQHRGGSSDQAPRALGGDPNQGPVTSTSNVENEPQRRQGGTGIQNLPDTDQDQPSTQQPPAAPNQTTDGGAPRNTADGTTERGVNKQPAITSLRERKPSATSRKPRQSPLLQGGGKSVGDQADDAEGPTRSSEAVQVSTGNVADSEPSANSYDQPPAPDTYTEPATDTTSIHEAPQSEPVYQEQVTQVAPQELRPAPQVATQRQKPAPQIATQTLEPANQVPSPTAPRLSSAPSGRAPQTPSPAPQPAAIGNTTIRNTVQTGGQK